MQFQKIIITSICMLFAANTYCEESHVPTSGFKKILTDHFDQYHEQEYFSGVSLSIYAPGKSIRNFYAGTISHLEKSKKVDKTTLFQIGSISKSFTAALVLQLDKEKLVNLNSKIDKWLPGYNKWSAVTVRQLLNMTSGLPNYSDTPEWNMQELRNPSTVWTSKELIEFVYPDGDFTPPLKKGYFYSNTGYILADMIIEKVSGKKFKEMLSKRLFKPAELSNTFYPVPQYEQATLKRMAHGYNYNQYDNPPLVGRDMIDNNLSWGAAAGGIVASTEDIVKWVRALFVEEKLLDANQKVQLTQLVSDQTGEPIEKASEENPSGFALGVTQKYNPKIGKFWFYEGETLGFRAIYIYVPCNGVIVSSAFNSATNSENDHSQELMIGAYMAMLKENPALHCK